MRHFKELLKAINLEREEQKRSALEEIKRLSGEKRERLGRAILNLRGRYVGREVGDLYVVKFGRSRPIDTDIDAGDVVLISRGDPLKSDLTGTVISKTSHSISVALSSFPPKWISKRVRMDLFYNDVTFKRMEDAIKRILTDDSLKTLKDLSLLRIDPGEIGKVDFDPIDDELNEFQIDAVSKALGSRLFFLVHGPPGTGKTRTLTEYIIQEVRRGKRVAASADSNAAVDNLLKNLIDRKIEVVRIGHPARVDKELLDHTLQALVEKDPDYKRVESLRKEAQKLIEIRDTFTKPEPKFRRGLSDEEIKRLSRLGRGSRGVSARTIESMARWIDYNEKVSSILEKAKDLEMEIVKKVLRDSKVVVGTNSSFGMDFMLDERFDVLVIDEATQSTEPSCLIPMTLSKKWVMAGDHKQLPPTVVSEKAKEVLSETLFERLLRKYRTYSLLRIQYRMNEKIMRFPSEKFYEGKLIAHESVKNRTLKDLGVSFDVGGWIGEVLNVDVPITIVDTSKRPDRFERQRPGSTSRENHLEAEIVIKLLNEILREIPPSDIGVITPYDDQVDLLKNKIKDVKVSTVDGFQGMEREVIIISFVRSNRSGDLGFLEDLRRLNVSITRARSKLIMIGDFSTLSKNRIYADLRRYVARNGSVVIV